MNQATLDIASNWVKTQYPHPIKVAIILGSGLGHLTELLGNPTIIPYHRIQGFPKSTVEGHKGQLILGELLPNFHVAFLQGRFHFYEGFSMPEVTAPVRLIKALGAQHLIVTNAAGGINADFQSGDLMLISDHLNLLGTNPLIGSNVAAWGPRFPDMSEAYTPSLRQLALDVAKTHNIALKQGVYCAMTGPSYETPAEIRMLRTLGADAVGMSTVPEVIVASHMGIEVLGISCITNAAAGVMPEHRLSHEEVLAASEATKTRFGTLLHAILGQLA